MEIYVKSRGFAQEEGYCWLPETPSILTVNRVADCIQTESPSLVLGRYGGRLLLLVTGFEARGRTDFRDRTSSLETNGAGKIPVVSSLIN